MTAGQISTPHRQIRTSLLVTALAVTFGSGLLTGLLAPRTIGQDAQAASKAGVVAASTGGGTLAAVATNPRRWAELQAAEIGGGGLEVDQVSANVGVVAASTGGGTLAAVTTNPRRLAELQAAEMGGGGLAAVATDPLRWAELQAAEIGGGGLEIDANSPSGR